MAQKWNNKCSVKNIVIWRLNLLILALLLVKELSYLRKIVQNFKIPSSKFWIKMSRIKSKLYSYFHSQLFELVICALTHLFSMLPFHPLCPEAIRKPKTLFCFQWDRKTLCYLIFRRFRKSWCMSMLYHLVTLSFRKDLAQNECRLKTRALIRLFL